MNNQRGKYTWVLLPVITLSLFLINISLGSVSIPTAEVITILFGGEGSSPSWRDILIDFRLTKALTCILAGTGLSIGGLLMQTLFRNPLASPDILGLSSGASLAVAVVVMVEGLGVVMLGGSYSVVIPAIFGSALIFFLVLLVAQRVRDNASLLLIGLMIGAAGSSIVSVLQFISRTEDQHYFLVWTFGSMGGLNWNEIGILSIICLGGLVLCMALAKPLNALLLGDQYAQSIGTRIQQSRVLIILGTSLFTGSITAFCGPIAFVGLVVPHLTRLLINTTNHRVLIPAVAVGGAGLMLLCDSIAQLPGSSYVLPINAITAFIGAPVVIWIIMRSKRIVV